MSETALRDTTRIDTCCGHCQVSSAAVTSAAQHREAAEVQARRETEFPSLAATLPSRPVPAPAVAPSAELPPGSQVQPRASVQDAFSEEEDWTSPGGLSDGGGEELDEGRASDGASPRIRTETATPPSREPAFGAPLFFEIFAVKRLAWTRLLVGRWTRQWIICQPEPGLKLSSKA